MDDDAKTARRRRATRWLVVGLLAAVAAFVVLLVYRVGILNPRIEMPLMRTVAVVGWLGTGLAIFATVRLYVLR